MAPRTKPEQVELPLFQVSEIVVAASGISISTDLIDFKDTAGGPRRNHRLQVTAYALLAEEAFERPAPDGFI